MSEWTCFLWAADEWLISYSLPPYDLSSVKSFSIGHAVELYLKAAYTKISGNIQGAKGHDIKKLLDDCRAADPTFMSAYEIRDTVLNINLLDGNALGSLSTDDYEHYFHHSELYTIAKLQADLKYLGTPLNKVKGQYGFLRFLGPHPYWIDFLKELRTYIGHPQKDGRDIIAHHIQTADIPSVSMDYLRKLYT